MVYEATAVLFIANLTCVVDQDQIGMGCEFRDGMDSTKVGRWSKISRCQVCRTRDARDAIALLMLKEVSGIFAFAWPIVFKKRTLEYREANIILLKSQTPLRRAVVLNMICLARSCRSVSWHDDQKSPLT